MADSQAKKYKQSPQSKPNAATHLEDARAVQVVLELFRYECGRVKKKTNYLPYQVKDLFERIEEPRKAAGRLVQHHEKIAKYAAKVREMEKRDAARPRVISKRELVRLIAGYKAYANSLEAALGVLTRHDRALKKWTKDDPGAARVTLNLIEHCANHLDLLVGYVSDARFRLSKVLEKCNKGGSHG